MRCVTMSLIVITLLLVPYVAFAQNVEYVGSYDSLNNASEVFILDNYAYIVAGNSGLQIINIANPVNPTYVGGYDTPGYANGVFVSGNYAYLVVNPDGLDIIDISNPYNPTLGGTFDSLLYARDVFVSGSYAYIADEAGLKIVDISDPSNPTLAGRYHLSVSSRVFVSGSNVYIDYALGGDPVLLGVSILDITDPAQPSWVANYNYGARKDIFISGNYMYLTADDLEIVDISNPTNPVFVGSYGSQNADYWCIFVTDSYAYIAAGDSGLQVVDISTPSNPTLAGRYDTPGYASGVFVLGGYSYVADDSSLQILRFTPTEIKEGDKLPNNFSLSQNYPNPFNAQTTIAYSLPTADHVALDVYDIMGRKVVNLLDGEQEAGEHNIVWNASELPSGIYFARLETSGHSENIRMVLLK
jgi:hypothetical protein